MLSFLLRRQPVAVLVVIGVVLACFFDCTSAVKIKGGSDPSVIHIGDTYYSAGTAEGGIVVRAASSLAGLGAENAQKKKVYSNSMPDVWAPELTTHNGKTYIYFTGGSSADHRMYVISADSPLGTYSSPSKLALPDDRFAIDGTYFVFEGQGWFVWSGWSGTENGEQNLYICKMSSPTQPTGKRFIISQPRESWEKADGSMINEGPEAIVDPNGQLHIVYSANGSWGSKYCLADLRLRKGGDPTYVWDWYKSNGCLFGSHQDRMMKGWDATVYIDGPGHHTFALPDGDVGESPSGSNRVPFVFHGVIKGTPYSWGARAWYTGTYVWWSKTTYSRANVPGDNSNSGYSFKFFEDRP